MHFSRQLTHLYGGDGDNDDIAASKVKVSLYFACLLEHRIFAPPALFYGGHLGDGVSFDKKYSFKENLKRIDHPPLNCELRKSFVGSCNGLMCLTMRHRLHIEPIYICNPVTREYVCLPELVVKKRRYLRRGEQQREINMYSRVTCGFGYVSSTNEYKVVRIHFPNSHYNGYVDVYTLGSGRGWRAKAITYFQPLRRNVSGTYANGAIYWIEEKHVLAFDLASEHFRLFSFPIDVEDHSLNGDIYRLVALGGNLCLYVRTSSHMEIWSLKKRGNESSCTTETWRMDFVIDYKGLVRSHDLFEPIMLTKKEEIILMHNGTALYCYDSKTTTLRLISDNDKASSDYFVELRAIPHVNTFVSLRAMGEKSKKYMIGTTWEDGVV